MQDHSQSRGLCAHQMEILVPTALHDTSTATTPTPTPTTAAAATTGLGKMAIARLGMFIFICAVYKICCLELNLTEDGCKWMESKSVMGVNSFLRDHDRMVCCLTAKYICSTGNMIKIVRL